MTINQNTKYILDHPQTKEAVEEYSKGNTKPLERLLFEIQFHVFDKTTLYCSKIYGLNKWNNSGVIKDFIRTAEPPTNLSIYLTTPTKSSL